MGNQKQKWTAEEEEALLAGVAKHGPGKWKNILKDPDFAPYLTHRSNIDLKDKWRNLSVSTSAQGSRDKSRAPKVKAIVASLPNTPSSAPAASRAHIVTTDAVVGDASNSSLDGKNAPRYNTMIFEALSTIKDTNGSDISAIVSYIEQRHEVPPNFRRLLSSRLRRLVSQGKLEKIQNCYKIRKDILMGTKTPTPKQKDIRLRQNSGVVSSGETMEEAAITAAYKVAEAENKSFLAAEAVKEAERVSKMAEDTDSMLQLVKEIYEQCSRGEIVLLA
ncbi:PREDICTED: telomere repeat-binding factor 4 [Theobroma cacao]|uniref:MYB transcription factor n=2 Tax=Theobroma cacao TaxID=3641 RepID=A0AB32V085_THECC|nr:PREDICTED: telomere repeat-binding factor 4 [Theobroma cacao]EOY27161.1 Homeodomain-like/winged-helix DNA-binding family protein, putative [Theobroma cacao]